MVKRGFLMKQIGIHLAIMLILALAVALAFFYHFLPTYTNHGETITVPDLKGLGYDELEEYLTNRDLRFEVEPDSGYNRDFAPLTVLKQYPQAGSKVKSNRKIFINLNKTKPHKVSMPNLLTGSIKSAYMVLESVGLEVGEIEYIPDFAQNAVLKQFYQGDPIEPGDSIYQGSQVDLVVGDGLGNQTLEVPALLGMDFEDAKFVVQSSGLSLGSIISVESNDTSFVGEVLRQIPSAGRSIRVGDDIDLWVVGYDEENGRVKYEASAGQLGN